MLATQVISRVCDLFQVEQFPLRRIFETPTVSGLLDAIAEIWGGIDAVNRIAETIYELQQLSDDQVEEILKARRAS